jgi:hypothetical protein
MLSSDMTAVVVEANGIEAVIKCSLDLLGSMYFCHLFSVNEKWGLFVFHIYIASQILQFIICKVAK